ncbi:receptor-like protein EIX2 [Prunus dulcis]|uniref:receptor-like protein EIX2 n=1 Tax=Prunus dulcis TaxID=3755 RepID=UPI001483A07D|nr:receptor-like protein EIX2 [Prunus dulcis]
MNSSNTFVHVDLSRNNPNSSIFQWLSGTHTNLVDLDLSRNNFNGSLIPDDFRNMSSLAYLTLSVSRLTGGIPNSFAKLCRLRELHLGNNSLSGQLSDIIVILSICAQNTIEYLDISDNHGIMGSVPENIGQMSKLEGIDFSGNSLEGVYDDEASLIWKGLRAEFKSNLGLLKTIDLSSNKLIGEIPSEITYLLGLIFLNLSRNQLTGQIPSRIGNWQELESLDLSRNQINGIIPTSLSRIASLGKLDLSQNNLFGKIPIGTQLQSFDYAYGGNPLLFGAPLPKTCSEEEKGPGQPVLVNQDSQDGLITQGYYMSMGLGFAVGFWGVCGTLLLNLSCKYTYFNFLTFLNDWLHVKAAIIRQRMLNR